MGNNPIDTTTYRTDWNSMYVMIGMIYSPLAVAPIVSAAASFYYCGTKPAAITFACVVSAVVIGMLSWKYLSDPRIDQPSPYIEKTIHYASDKFALLYFCIPAVLAGGASLATCGPYAAMVSFVWTMVGIMLSIFMGMAYLLYHRR